ncbi:MAG: 50S ribosomal protein L11 methyltransferase [Chloroflexi bacterium]|nr:50S ribosomal protein L11 methyltransferase [Chloroflexota bacterium]
MVAREPAAAEAVAALFNRLGRGGAVWEETPDGEAALLKTYLTDDAHSHAARQELEIGLALLASAYPSLSPPLFVRLAPADWAEAWKQAYDIQQIGRALAVVPSWKEYTPQPGQHVLYLDPGMAFGTGLHPTTRLCLELVEAHLVPGRRLLDVGTGSGILAVAAARLGAAQVLALEADPLAVRVATENVDLNHVGQTVTVRWGTVGGGEGSEWAAPALAPEEGGAPYHVVVVNILADVVGAMLSAGLAAWLAHGGLLIVSGIIQRQASRIAELMTAAGLKQVEARTSGEWVALAGKKGDQP